MLKQKLFEITPGSVADYLIRLAVLVMLQLWLMAARETIAEISQKKHNGLLTLSECKNTRHQESSI